MQKTENRWWECIVLYCIVLHWSLSVSVCMRGSVGWECVPVSPSLSLIPLPCHPLNHLLSFSLSLSQLPSTNKLSTNHRSKTKKKRP
ncbi:hypothetical protein BJ741DRAFT_594538 [Chytriomyces cf. hyalinus JEL632]|nr:hypothetical protein BJ741DRAFT_594538 [Chytriomyces cf. hyalinus JEL632]